MIPGCVKSIHCICIRCAGAYSGVGVGERRARYGSERRAITNNLIASDADIIGAGGPGKIHFGRLGRSCERSVGIVGGCVSAAAETVTVATAVTEPELFEAVRVYVVVWAGKAEMLDRLVTLPTPLSMLTDVAPETFQASVTGLAAAVLVGVAVNEEITGTGLLTGALFCQKT